MIGIKDHQTTRCGKPETSIPGAAGCRLHTGLALETKLSGGKWDARYTLALAISEGIDFIAADAKIPLLDASQKFELRSGRML